MKKYCIENLVTQELLSSETKIDDEYLYRNNIHKLIQDIPIKELSKIFILEKLDPFSTESEQKLNDYRTPDAERQIILHHRNMGTLKFTTTININEKL